MIPIIDPWESEKRRRILASCLSVQGSVPETQINWRSSSLILQPERAMMLRLHPTSRAKILQRLPWGGLVALREGKPALRSSPRQRERRSHERQRLRDGSQRIKNDSAREGGLKVALRELAISLKKWDAAIFKILDADRVSSMQRAAYDTPADCTPLLVGMRVQKVGRTTGSTMGEVVAEMPDCEPIEYGVDIIGGKKHVYFSGLFAILTTGGFFSQPGDSGSLIVNLDQNNARHSAGIIVGGDETGLAFALSMHRVLEHFDVELVSAHNV